MQIFLQIRQSLVLYWLRDGLEPCIPRLLQFQPDSHKRPLEHTIRSIGFENCNSFRPSFFMAGGLSFQTLSTNPRV
eukprot:Skav217380  [mRNA]  locus=scaffold4362:10930:11157:+ [translate_table: standard]